MFFMIEEFKKKLECPADELAFYTKEPMNRHTSFRIGGPADLLVMPKTERAVCCAVKAAKQAGLPLTVLGNGSNVLVRDEGIRGVVLCIGTEYGAVHVEGTAMQAQTGALLSVLANEALKNSLTGLEFAGGIPGSLGGALFMDAGAYGGQMADVVVSSRYYDAETDTIGTLTGKQHAFGYRTSAYKDHPQWVALVFTSDVLDLIAGGLQVRNILSGTHINSQRDALIFSAGRRHTNFGKRRNQRYRHIVHAVITQIFQSCHCSRFS